MARDPRVEPRAGDVLGWENGNTRKCERRFLDAITFAFNGEPGYRTSLYTWRAIAATATIIHVAEG